MIQVRKAGLKLTSQAAMKASQTPDGSWVVWLELKGAPLTDNLGKPKLFEGPTRYQAQCKAYKWYSLEPVFASEMLD
jgi:hypothetical protein